jgi:hypothetical protein
MRDSIFENQSCYFKEILHLYNFLQEFIFYLNKETDMFVGNPGRRYVQSEIPYSIGNNSPVPPSIPGSVSAGDFVSFEIPKNFPPGYHVMIPTLVAAGPNYSYTKSIGELSSIKLLPNAHIDPNGMLMLVPSRADQPAFGAPVHRGGRYIVPENCGSKFCKMDWSF